MFKPNEITKENVLAAIQKIESQNLDLIKSTRWLVEIDGKSYPPKEVMRYAHQQMNGSKIWRYGGGPPTNKYLEKMGFKIIDKTDDPIKDLIDKYKEHLRNDGLRHEIYKWELLSKFQGRPNIEADNLSEEFKSINYENLIYPLGIAVINELAKERTEKYRSCLKVLFNEKESLENRLRIFEEDIFNLYSELKANKKLLHHHDERTIATLLTYRNPEKYTFFKDSFYQKYCRLIGIKAKQKGEKYIHYLSLVDELIEDYIINDKELLDLFHQALPESCFQDSNYKILAQDILFQTLDLQIGVERGYWRIGTTDEGKSYWEEMITKEVVSIGWPDLGDLADESIPSKKEAQELLTKAGYYIEDKRMLSRKAGELLNFYSNIKIRDVVLAQEGAKVLGIGIITDEYIYDNSSGFPHQKRVKWVVENPELKNTEGLQTTVFKISDIKTINQIDELLNSDEIMEKESSNVINRPLNQILFGPPGTGKTYNTINKALEIIGVETEGKNREEVKQIFDSKLKEGQIVFTTFHQSMSYEDFIEGIKPISREGEIFYEIEDGIFKQLCNKAFFAHFASNNQDKLSKFNEFDTLYEEYIRNIEERLNKLQEGKQLLLPLKTNGYYTEVKSINEEEDYLLTRGTRANSDAKVHKERLRLLYNKYSSIEEIKDVAVDIRSVGKGLGWSSNYYGVFKDLKLYEAENSSLFNKQPNKKVDYKDYQKIKSFISTTGYPEIFKEKVDNFVIIIDEINRGNIANIFGELITLIEEDKRAGNDEEIVVELPYSKQNFTVPKNLYIIGTMNTADRSVEALDTALRRRFNFIEMPPDHTLTELDYLIAGQKAAKILETINSRIEKLLDKDHLIGHSYFIKKDVEEDVSRVKESFYKNIIPLLQEYFYGDFGKIGLVLGKGFVEKKKWNNNGFADFDHESSAEFEEREVYQIIDYRDDKTNSGFERAIKLLMNEKVD